MLDYADQRYYASSYGRFNTVDPSSHSVHPKIPGSWNRYAYVGGDPVNHNDPRGLDQSVCTDPSDPDCPASPEPDPCWDLSLGLFDGSVNCGAPVEDGDGGDASSSGDSSSPAPTCEQQLTSTIAGALAGTPLAGEASDFVEDAQWGGLNPLLLVAIAGDESSYGVRIVPGSNNPFGLLHGVRGKDRKVHYVPINYGNWNDAINAAVSTIDKQFVNGNVTVSELYSGLPGAYCVGPSCSQGAKNVASIFQALGGGNPNNSFNLLWPCKD